MNPEQTLARVRRFLLVIAAIVFLMTVTKLFFLSDWSETIQLLPFILSGLGLATLALAFFRPSRMTINLLRWSMVVIGIYQHMENNYGFQMEIQPNATTQEFIWATLEAPIPF